VPPEPGDLIQLGLGSRVYITRFQQWQLVQSYSILPMYRLTNFTSQLSNKVTLAVSSYKICHTTSCLAFIFVFRTKVPNSISYLIPNYTQPSISPSITKMYARLISKSASVLQTIFTTDSLLQQQSSNSISPNYTSQNFTPNNNLVSNS
jgi:hypothetical protein